MPVLEGPYLLSDTEPGDSGGHGILMSLHIGSSPLCGWETDDCLAFEDYRLGDTSLVPAQKLH